MIEFVIHGRGGRGGVTLAKLLAGAYYRRGLHVQAFGFYGAERTGAPVQAYVRVDEREIDVYGPITSPDHVIIVDPSLASPASVTGERPGGWTIVNCAGPLSPSPPCSPGARSRRVDADSIAVAHHLGTHAVPIVNTALLGAAARVLGLALGRRGGRAGRRRLRRRQRDGGAGRVRAGRRRGRAGGDPRARAERRTPSLSFLDERVGTRPEYPHGRLGLAASAHARS